MVYYHYDGGDSVLEYDDGGSLTKYLARGSSYGGGIGGVIYTENANGDKEYFVYNALGSTTALTDDNGTVTSATAYDGWGKEVWTYGDSGNNRLFSTKERSRNLGLDYFGYRYYDYDLGRFTVRDPAGYPNGPNNYLYCTNDPVNQIDPLGLYSWKQFWTDTVGTAVELGKMAADSIAETASVVGEGTAALATGKMGVGEFASEVGNTAVDAVKSEIEKNADRISTQVEGGAGWVEATVNTAAMMVGDVTGATDLAEAAHGTSSTDGRELTTTERVSKALTGTGKAAATGAALGKTYNPDAKFLPKKTAPPPKVGPTVDNLEGLCFTGETLISSAVGMVRITEIQVGDYVYAMDIEAGGQPVLSLVTDVIVRQTDSYYRVRLSDDTVLNATAEHPFWVNDRGWTMAADLVYGDQVYSLSGKLYSVTELELVNDPTTVYNFTVEGLHTYFAGESSILVHNASCAAKPPPAGEPPPNLSPKGAGRRGALRQAKRDSGVPTSQQGTQGPNLDRRGNVQPGRQYEYKDSKGNTIKIRDDSKGHSFGPKDPQNRGRHFNTPDGGHYDY